MKLSRILMISILLTGLTSCNTTPSQKENTEEQEENAGRVEYQFERLKDPATGQIPENIKMKELVFSSSLPRINSRSSSNNQQIYKPIGPRNVGGRTRAISFDIDQPNVILAGGVSGGMWRSSDFGQSWKRATNYEDHSAVSCVIQDTRPGKSNVFYYGSGEITGNSASKSRTATYFGSGLYKSEDHGITWQHLTSTSTSITKSSDWSYVHNIAIDQSNNNLDIVYAATTKGIRRSTDGGTTWNLVLGGAINSDWSNIVVTSTGVCYAHISNNGFKPGFWRSTDGINWVNISPIDLPLNHERTLMAIAPSNENIIYFYTNTPNIGSDGNSFWKYTYINGDGTGNGANWENRSANLPPSIGYDLESQQNYCMSLAVKPTNENMIYLGGTNLFRSKDGFSTTNSISQIGGYKIDGYTSYNYYKDNQHPDQQSIAFPPNNPENLLAATDGGLHFTTNPEDPKVIWQSFNNGYQTTQLFGLSIDQQSDKETVMSGYQDNGSWLTHTADTLTNWLFMLSGDGSYCAKENGKNTYYFSGQHGAIRKTELSNNSTITNRTNITPNNLDDGYLFITPFILDPIDNNTMYLPNDIDLWKNNDLSAANTRSNWKKIASLGGKISAITANENTPGVIYVGTSTRKIYKLIDNGSAAADVIDITGNINTGNYASSIDIDPNNPDNIVVVYSNYNVISIWLSTDAGNTWTDIEGNLAGETDPGVPPALHYIGNGPSFRCAKFINTPNGSGILAGTSIGLYAASNFDGENTTWTQQAPNLIGNVVIEQVAYRESDGFCVIGTHGAGLFKTYFNQFSNSNITGIETIDEKSINLNVYPNPTASNATLTFENTQNETIHINILNSTGQIVNHQYVNTTPGKNQVDLELNNLPTGIYYVSINTEQGQFTKAIVKQ